MERDGATMEAYALRVQRLEREVEFLRTRAQEMAVAQACVDEKLGGILAALAELKEGVQRLQQLPAKRWEMVIGAVISALCALVTGVLLGQGL